MARPHEGVVFVSRKTYERLVVLVADYKREANEYEDQPLTDMEVKRLKDFLVWIKEVRVQTQTDTE